MNDHLRRPIIGAVILVVLAIVCLVAWSAWDFFGWWLLAFPAGATVCYFVGFAFDRVDEWDRRKRPRTPRQKQSHSYPGY